MELCVLPVQSRLALAALWPVTPSLVVHKALWGHSGGAQRTGGKLYLSVAGLKRQHRMFVCHCKLARGANFTLPPTLAIRDFTGLGI